MTEPTPVKIVGLDLPMGTLVALLVRIAIAAIPAAVILCGIYLLLAFIVTLTLAVFSAVGG